MKQQWKATLAALSLLLTAAVMPARGAGAQVQVDGVPLSVEQAWIEDGTSYITLRSLETLTDYDLSWNGSHAKLLGEGLELTAQPGTPYIEVNGRVLYVEDGVSVRDGVMYLPLRVIAQAMGGALSWDGAQWVARLELRQAIPPQANYRAEDLDWLSRIISAESRGESLLGQIAVGNVVLNRVEHENYPDNIREVVLDQNHGFQFEPVENGTVYQPAVPSAVLAAKMCLEGADVVEDCLYFFAPALSEGTWIVENATYYTTIGCHRFYCE